jgi:hypothetical protein
MHGGLVLEEFSVAQRFTFARHASEVLVPLFLPHCPIVLLALAAPWILFRHPARPFLTVAAAVIAMFALAVPFLVPSTGGLQWGPRFLLLAAPLACWAAARALAAGGIHLALRALVAIAFAALVALGGRQAYQGPRHLANIYAQRQRALDRLRADPSPVITASSDLITQQLVPALADRAFFLTRRGRDFRVLADGLERRGLRRFVYACYRRRPCEPLPGGPDLFDLPLHRPGAVLHMTKLGAFDDYVLYEAVLAETARPGAWSPEPLRKRRS